MAADELVDVVDAEDRVVGRVTRAEMRARRLRHRATYLLVFNSRGELFVHLRTATSFLDQSAGNASGRADTSRPTAPSGAAID